jgi:hypothetical protein
MQNLREIVEDLAQVQNPRETHEDLRSPRGTFHLGSSAAGWQASDFARQRI